MRTNSLFWAMSWVAVGSFAIMQGCGGDDDDGGDGGGDDDTGGKGGSTTGGSTSTGGKGGSTTGGSTSTGGKGGSTTGGSTSTGGAGGAPGGVGGESSGGEGGSGDADRATVCADYCALYSEKGCFEAAADTYNDEFTCRVVCNAETWELGTQGDADGNTVHCRFTHAGLASATNMPDETHCGHAAATPTGICVD